VSKPMMKCGHAAQGVLSNGAPVCVICSSPDATTVDDTYTPDPERLMRCSYANGPSKVETHNGGGQYAGKSFPSTRPSNPQGAFFKAQPDKAEDQFYCGCWGWD
jgi:hypothetical protein